MMTLRIRDLAGIFTAEGLLNRGGRRPQIEDCGFCHGPLDLVIDLENGSFVKMEKSAPRNPGENEREIDGKGLVATAGFIDSHTHALASGTRAREYFLRWSGKSYREISDQGGGIHNTFAALRHKSDELLLEELLTTLRKMRAAGTLSVEVKSGYGQTPEGELRSLRIIKRAKEHPQCPVNVRSTYLPLHALPKEIPESDYVTAMIATLPTIAAEKLADHVDAFPEAGFFSLEESLRFAREAFKHGFKSKVHADELTPMACVESFVPLEALSVDHLQKISAQGIASLESSKTVATFLPTTSFYLDLPYAPARQVVDAGARVALASDFNPGTSPELGLQFTALLAASRMKLSAAEIFCALTFNAAAALGIDDHLGAIAPGYQADLLLWNLVTEANEASNGQDLLEEIFVESRKPTLTLRAGK